MTVGLGTRFVHLLDLTEDEVDLNNKVVWITCLVNCNLHLLVNRCCICCIGVATSNTSHGQYSCNCVRVLPWVWLQFESLSTYPRNSVLIIFSITSPVFRRQRKRWEMADMDIKGDAEVTA